MEEMVLKKSIWKLPYVISKRTFLMMQFLTNSEWDFAEGLGFSNSNLIFQSKRPIFF